MVYGGDLGSLCTSAVGRVDWSDRQLRQFGNDADQLESTTSGSKVLWTMNAGAVQSATSLGSLAAEWKLSTATDINGDGYNDILLENVSTGARAIWLEDGGASVKAAPLLTVLDPAWHLAGSLVPDRGPTVRPVSNWATQSYSAVQANLLAVWASGPNDIYVAGEGPAQNGVSYSIAHFDGTSWHGIDIGATTAFAIWGSGPSDVFAVCGQGKIFHFNGTTWNEQASGTSNPLYGVWGSSPSNVYAVGGNGTLLHYDGTTWNAMALPRGYGGNAIWGSSGSDIYVVGGGSAVLHFDGTLWSTVNVPATYSSIDYRAVSGRNKNDVFVVGDNELLRFDGSTWTASDVNGPGNVLTGVAPAGAKWGPGSRLERRNSPVRWTYTHIRPAHCKSGSTRGLEHLSNRHVCRGRPRNDSPL